MIRLKWNLIFLTIVSVELNVCSAQDLKAGVVYIPAFHLSQVSDEDIFPFETSVAFRASTLLKVGISLKNTPFELESGFGKWNSVNSVSIKGHPYLPKGEGFKQIRTTFEGYIIPLSGIITFYKSKKFAFKSQLGIAYLFEFLELFRMKSMAYEDKFLSKTGEEYTMRYVVIANSLLNKSFSVQTGLRSTCFINKQLNLDLGIVYSSGLTPILGNVLLYEITSSSGSYFNGERVFASKGDAVMAQIGISYTFSRAKDKVNSHFD